jgi:uncharacterized membrane protein
MRYVHIVCAVVVVGGMAFISLCLWPASETLEEQVRAKFLGAVQKRFLRVVLWAIGGLAVSGGYN